MAENKKAVIDEAVKMLDKKYGAKTIIKMGAIEEMTVEAIKTNCFSLDNVFGCGGIPRGRIIELFGLESSGKSTLALFIAAQVQKQGGSVCWIDAEHAFDSDYAQKIGVEIKGLYVSQPSTGEEALDIVDKMASTSAIDLIVLDSVAALVPKRELEGDLLDNEMAQTARMMSKAMRMLSGNISKTNTAVIFINQVREKVGVFWGKKEITPGGKALKFFASVRLEVHRGKQIKRGEEIVGTQMTFCAVKNKVGMPFRTGELEMIFGEGVDIFGDILVQSVDKGLIKLIGRSYVYGETNIGENRESAIKRLLEDEKLFKELYYKLEEISKTRTAVGSAGTA
jgi:recombination protein RecA